MDRLRSELSRAQTRLQRLRREYDGKWVNLRRAVSRIRYYETRIRLAEAEVKRARKKTRARFRAAEDELADRRAAITPYLAERERIIDDINYERDVLLLPLQSRIRTLTVNIRAIEDELERRAPPPPPPPPPPVGYVEREYTAYLEYPSYRATAHSPEVRFEARGIFTIPVGIDPEDDHVKDVIQDKLIDAIVEISGVRTYVDAETREVITETVAPTINPEAFDKGVVVGTEDLGVVSEFTETVSVDIVKYHEMREIQRWRTTVSIGEEELTG